MSQSAVPNRLKKLKTSLQGRSETLPKSSTCLHSRLTELVQPKTVHRILRIFLGDPWDDYNVVRYLRQDMIARRKASYFKLVNIRPCQTSDILDEQPRILSSIQHPNIATVYDIYCDDDKVFLITEHLHLSILQLDFQKYELEEWEIATIIAEVQATTFYKDVIT
jgi:serine/threonine protein kinase